MPNYDKHPTVKVGDVVRCKRRVAFTDGTAHNPNDELEVTHENLAYYQFFLGANSSYELLTRR